MNLSVLILKTKKDHNCSKLQKEIQLIKQEEANLVEIPTGKVEEIQEPNLVWSKK